MRWHPDKLWDGEDAFIIGGGRSLESFDFSLLETERTVGCNNAYRYGPKICNICAFGDTNWLDHHKDRVTMYVEAGGFVVTNCTQLEASPLVWLHWMPRRGKGLHTDALGWNKNTGAVAINIALLLGAKNVYLLGFDRFLIDGKPNWHDEQLDKYKPEIYPNMSYADGWMKKDLKKKFPGAHVVNVSDKTELQVWPVVSATKFWKERENVRTV